MADELLERYQCDRDRRAYERLVETHRPLVRAVCRRWLRDPDDVDDVVQETFLKLARHIDRVNGSAAAWLSATAQANSVDLIRRSARQRNRRRALARNGSGSSQVEHLAAREAIRLRLPQAMAAIEPAARQVLTERFLRNTPLRVLAAQLDTSVPTASRQVTRAVRQLAEVLRDMGVATADHRAVGGHLGAASWLGELGEADDQVDHGGLRFAPDWRSAALTPLGCGSAPQPLAGCERPLRVGALLSYDSTQIVGANRRQMDLWNQVSSTTVLPPAGLQLVGVVEPGTAHRGIVECTLRDYGIVGGLVEADDAAALQTLDVLIVGINWSMTRAVARAINRAVRSGVGLLNEYWTATHVGTCDEIDKRELMLADSPIYAYHVPGECGAPAPATVRHEHPLLPGLKAGTRMTVAGCGPLYRAMRGAQVLIAKDRVIEPGEHAMSNAGPMRMPCYIVGQLGRGRVVVNHVWPPHVPGVASRRGCEIAEHVHVDRQEYFLNLLRWLAGSRQEGA